MTLRNHLRMTASELAIGRYLRAPEHTAADDEFDAAFSQFGNEPAAGAADDKGGKGDDTGGAGATAAAGEPGGASGGDDDGGAAAAGGAAAPAADDKGGAAAAADDKGGAAADDKGGAAAADDKGAAAGGDADAVAAAAAAAAAPADDKGGKKPAKAAAAAPDNAGESDDDVLKRLAKAVKKVDTDETAAAAAEQEPAPLFSAEENQKIEHFRKEWPEVAEAFDLQARALAQSVLKYAFEQIGGVVNPMRETLDILATRTHYGDLKDKVGEYSDEERQEIIDWVGTQPKYLQAPMLSVIDEGTAEEVADLVGRYRGATGKQPAPKQAGDLEPPAKDVELSGAAKQAAADLAPVSTKRSAVAAPEDQTDYNGAFAKFADELG